MRENDLLKRDTLTLLRLKKSADPKQILEEAYELALKEFNKDRGESFLLSLSSKARNWVKIIAKNAEKQKAVVAALITSLTKKIETPTQDVRYHKAEFPGGYSGRTFDTKYVTPFLKKKFPRIAMKESGWLTRSIEQPHPFTLNFPGRIKSKQTKTAFLEILNDIEENKADPHRYLVALFILLLHEASRVQTTISAMQTISIKKVDINSIVNCLKLHFFHTYTSPGASKLPVIAIYSLYEIMMKEISRYEGKKLLPLRSHISPDARVGRIGDIEVVDENGNCFEAVEIKFGIQIDSGIVEDSYRKFKPVCVKRYYLLTTEEPFIKEEERATVENLIRKIKSEHGCEVIINGVMQSIKYYLRLIKEPTRFISVYTNNLELDASKTAEIKEEHVRKWLEILRTVHI